MGKYIEYYFENNRLNNMVDFIIIKNFGWLPQKDYDDFYSIAGQTLWYCEEHFDESKQKDFRKYLIDSLYRKFKTQITFINRKKRNNGVPEISMQQMIDSDEDVTIEDTIATKMEDEISYLTQRYVDSLPKMQKRVAEMIMDGYDNQTIKMKLNVSDSRFKMIIQRMKAKEKIEPLEKLKGVRK